MDWVLAILLFLHVGGAIIAFGPTFTFPLIGAMGGREPQHVNFALRLAEAIEMRFVLPLAVFQGVTGVLLIWRTGLNVVDLHWLGLSTILYLIALAIAFGVALPTVRKLVEATSTLPLPPAPGSPPPSGPPPHVAALVKRQQRAGISLSVLLVVIIFLMSGQPVF